MLKNILSCNISLPGLGCFTCTRAPPFHLCPFPWRVPPSPAARIARLRWGEGGRRFSPSSLLQTLLSVSAVSSPCSAKPGTGRTRWWPSSPAPLPSPPPRWPASTGAAGCSGDAISPPSSKSLLQPQQSTWPGSLRAPGAPCSSWTASRRSRTSLQLSSKLLLSCLLSACTPAIRLPNPLQLISDDRWNWTTYECK